MRGEISQRNIVSCCFSCTLRAARADVSVSRDSSEYVRRYYRFMWHAAERGCVSAARTPRVHAYAAARVCSAQAKLHVCATVRNGPIDVFSARARGRGARTKRDETSARWIFDLNRTGTARELCACDVANVRESVRTPKSPSDYSLRSPCTNF